MIETAIENAYTEYGPLMDKCAAFSDKLYCDAVKAGGVQYAEMLSLAYRQAISAHKCVVDTEGPILFISKECFSNGCAATVDVSYPSIPMFLLYNPELVKGMMRPIYKYAASDEWSKELKFDFVLADLGVSSMQIDNPDRGFSYKVEGPLDLRMNPEKGISAAERLDGITVEELLESVKLYGKSPYGQHLTRVAEDRLISDINKS